MNCKPEAVKLMHIYLDGDLTKEEESHLLGHLKTCDDCQRHFHELKRMITSIQYAQPIEAPDDFMSNVMGRLPKEKRRSKFVQWIKAHPAIIAAAVIFILLFSSAFSAWTQDERLVVSKQDNLVIEGDTVIVPEGVTVNGDLLVKNGRLKIEGAVDGNVTLVKSTLITEGTDMDGIMASAGEVSGEMRQVNEAFDWMWFNIKKTVKGIFSF